MKIETTKGIELKLEASELNSKLKLELTYLFCLTSVKSCSADIIKTCINLVDIITAHQMLTVGNWAVYYCCTALSLQTSTTYCHYWRILSSIIVWKQLPCDHIDAYTCVYMCMYMHLCVCVCRFLVDIIEQVYSPGSI